MDSESGSFFTIPQDPLTEKIYGFIYELFVLEEFRGKGIARKLIETGIEHLKQDGYSEIRLQTRERESPLLEGWDESEPFSYIE
ncbi:acetyltransferase, GNAT family [Geobacillus proteiniphilus]|uniref:Acetyltransferase, GNAT family n=1 Tax=Geobacillus proteiniphilus TaxID=860353 RepID=A0A1Q5T0A3_9BACL|nr:acetyltransferase, GNAT family [Geobacillus proteiniphilus]